MRNAPRPSPHVNRMRRILWALTVASLVGSAILSASAQSPAPPAPPAPNLTSATYAAALRRADGRVDARAMAARLTELGVSTYYWLVAQPNDWEDLQLFLPEAAKAGVQVWPYLLPPSESAPRAKQYSEPFKLDYQLWAEEIAKLSLKFPNLGAWVIDDFYANRALYTPEYVRGMRERSRAVNPKLAFLPLMYFNEIDRSFVENYRDAIDGVVVAYPQDRAEIDQAFDMLNDVVVSSVGDLRFPTATHSAEGDFVMAGQTARVAKADRHTLRFREVDDYHGATDGYHFKQLLVDGAVAWESDVAGEERGWRDVEVDATALLEGKKEATIAFRLFDKKGVANFPVRWRVKELLGDGLELAAGLDHPEVWKVTRRGGFEAGFGDAIQPGHRAFHIPFVVMTAAQEVEFRLRHADPATPERMATWLKMCLEAQKAGKCDAVVTYCLDLKPNGAAFGLARDLFHGGGVSPAGGK